MSIESKLGDRVQHLVDVAHYDLPAPEAARRIMADVEVALVLARREGWNALRAAEALLYTTTPGYRRYPLPKRTRQVLREEPVPGMSSPLYRWLDGRLEACSGGPWGIVSAVLIEGTVAVMSHALDLRSNPYRTVEVEVDEADPWGERDVPDTTEE